MRALLGTIWLWVLCLPLLAANPAGRVPPPEDVREADAITRLFLGGRNDELLRHFTPSLAARLGKADLEHMQAHVSDRGGKLRYIQAPWIQSESAGIQRLVVPVDLEKGGMDLVLEWDTTAKPRMLRGLWTANRTTRPEPQRDTDLAAAIPFKDADYIDRALFEEQAVELDRLQFEPREIILSRPIVPAGARVPVVILLPGKGAVDVDGTFGRNKPLRDLAQGLATRGVAVVRMGPYSGQPARDLEKHVLGEARALAVLARDAPWSDPASVYTAGFDEAAHAAFLLAREETWMGGSVMLSPPSQANLAYEIAHQRFLAEAGLADAEYPDYLESLRNKDEMHQTWPSDIFHDATFGLWQELAEISPLRTLNARSGDVLVIFGQRDYMAGEQQREEWQRLAEAYRNLWVRTEPGASRWLIPGEGTPRADLKDPGHVSKAVIDRIAGFVKATQLRGGARQKVDSPPR
ncbi:hypothetical protein GC173_07930 [bacterium]|nr:hypothetical protein [bacterium]